MKIVVFNPPPYSRWFIDANGTKHDITLSFVAWWLIDMYIVNANPVEYNAGNKTN